MGPASRCQSPAPGSDPVGMLVCPGRVQQEINEVIGQVRRPEMGDQARMPFTMAVIHEVQRFGDIIPLGLPHMTSRDTEVQGFLIPKVGLWPSSPPLSTTYHLAALTHWNPSHPFMSTGTDCTILGGCGYESRGRVPSWVEEPVHAGPGGSGSAHEKQVTWPMRPGRAPGQVCSRQCVCAVNVWWQGSQHPSAQTPPISSISCQGTMIITNLSSVLKDETLWKEPFRFHPEHFLDAQGRFVKQAAFMPFSAGACGVPSLLSPAKSRGSLGGLEPRPQAHRAPHAHPQAAAHASGSPWPAWSSSSSSPASCSTSASPCLLGSPALAATVSTLL